MDDDTLRRLATELGERLLARAWHVATAESCTGGWIAKTITDVAGSSEWFGSGFVSYSNAAKVQMLGVRQATLEQHGAVSAAVAEQMAVGAQRSAGANLAVAVTGIAGPGGGSAAKPVGTVWFGWANDDGCETQQRHFEGDREAIRRHAVGEALSGLLAALDR